MGRYERPHLVRTETAEIGVENPKELTLRVREKLEKIGFAIAGGKILLRGFSIEDLEKIFLAYLDSFKDVLVLTGIFVIKDKENKPVSAILKVQETKQILEPEKIPRQELDYPHYIFVIPVSRAALKARKDKKAEMQPQLVATLHRNENDRNIGTLHKVWAHIVKCSGDANLLNKLKGKKTTRPQISPVVLQSDEAFLAKITAEKKA